MAQEVVAGHVSRLDPGSCSQLGLHRVSMQPARLALIVNQLDDGVLIAEVQRCVAGGEDGSICQGGLDCVRWDGWVKRH